MKENYEEHKKNEDKLNSLKPVGLAKSYEEYLDFTNNIQLEEIRAFERNLLEKNEDKPFWVKGYCIPCGEESQFYVDGQYSDKTVSPWTPNWRERLTCKGCGMNNRMRLTASLVKKFLHGKINKSIYYMEQVTATFQWAEENLLEQHLIGSEYLGPDFAPGETINGRHHEDIENLSFKDNSVDLIISNDVFEHVPNPNKGFAECHRVLKKGGELIASIPFHQNKQQSVSRAKITDNGLTHLLPEEYHANPISDKGSLVFTDFGWDILNNLIQSGFQEAFTEFYLSSDLGHLGNPQIIFRAIA